MHDIERELIEATGYKARQKYANRQDYLKSILNAVAKLTDDDFDALTDETAFWVNAPVEAHNSKNEEIVDFDELDPESDEPEDDVEGTEDEPEQDHDPETGEVLEDEDELPHDEIIDGENETMDEEVEADEPPLLKSITTMVLKKEKPKPKYRRKPAKQVPAPE